MIMLWNLLAAGFGPLLDCYNTELIPVVDLHSDLELSVLHIPLRTFKLRYSMIYIKQSLKYAGNLT